MVPSTFTLERDDHGQLVWQDKDGQRHVGVQPVRAFPLSAPEAGISLIGLDGHEVAWLPSLALLSPTPRALVEEALAVREFAPLIQRLLSVSSFGTPSTWTVDTDRGRVAFVLKAEEDIRRLGEAALLVSDSHGIAYRITDRWALDRRSRRLLERFL